MKKVELKIHGMTCASCEIMVERKFKQIPGIEKVNVNHATGKATIYFSKTPQLRELQNAVKENGYSVSLPHIRPNTQPQIVHRNTKKDYAEIGAVFLIVVAFYLTLRQFDFIPKSLGISDGMSYGFVFLIGLVAAVSTCIAVTGGLLLAVAAKYNEQNPNLNGYQKFKPHIYFNIGRVASYTLLGGVVGSIGSVLTISTKTAGILTVFVSLVMLILGFQLLNLFPWMKRFQPKMPKFLAHKIHDMSGSQRKGALFILGGSTFFLPCGFTQALQLYILTTGSFEIGALTMLAFSLGTLPALVSLGAISNFIKGAFQKHFLRFAGVVVVMLGFFNINNGLALTGSNISLASIFPSSQKTVNAESHRAPVIGGRQIVSMKIIGLSYSPHKFTIVQGVPVEWHINGTEAQGCAQVVTVPKLGITEYLPRTGEKVITFVPKEIGVIQFSCTMGMTTRGSTFNVISNTEGIVGVPVGESLKEETGVVDISDPNAQKLVMEISREKGIYPNSFTVKKDVPVELTIDSRVPLGGCMSVFVIPKYNVTIPMKIGEIKVKFTPTETGTVAMTCSMGSRMAQFTVID